MSDFVRESHTKMLFGPRCFVRDIAYQPWSQALLVSLFNFVNGNQSNIVFRDKTRARDILIVTQSGEEGTQTSP